MLRNPRLSLSCVSSVPPSSSRAVCFIIIPCNPCSRVCCGHPLARRTDARNTPTHTHTTIRRTTCSHSTVFSLFFHLLSLCSSAVCFFSFPLFSSLLSFSLDVVASDGESSTFLEGALVAQLTGGIQIRRKLVIVGDGESLSLSLSLSFVPCSGCLSYTRTYRRMREDLVAVLVRTRRVSQGICKQARVSSLPPSLFPFSHPPHTHMLSL